MSEAVVLRLGTIIRIISPSNDVLHEKIFFINYLDNRLIKLINPEINEEISLNIDSKGTFLDTSIENIEVLSLPEEEGFARQNDLLPNKWISIRFGGDLPLTINGQITNLENDMIEINTYPDNDVIYINFDYKGIPLDLPILSFQEIKPPKTLKLSRVEEVEKEEKEKKEEEGPVDDEDENINEELLEEEKRVPDSEILNELESELNQGNEIIFLEDLGSVEELVKVSDSEKRYSIEEQKIDLLDSLLSDVPTLERNNKVMNFFKCTQTI